jgi:hypothetical protein
MPPKTLPERQLEAAIQTKTQELADLDTGRGRWRRGYDPTWTPERDRFALEVELRRLRAELARLQGRRK